MTEKIIVSLLFFSLIMLSFLVLTNPMKVNKKANIWFGLFILIWSSFWLDEIILITGNYSVNLNTIPLVNFIQFLSPILLFLSIQLFTNPSYKFNKQSIVHLISPIACLLCFILQPFLGDNFHVIFLGLLLTNSIFYISWAFIKIRQHKKNIKQFSSNPEDYNLQWLEFIIMAFVGITVLITIFNIIYYQHQLNVYMYLAMLINVYFIAYHSMKQKEIYPINDKQTSEIISITEEKTVEEGKRKMVTNEKLIELKSELNRLMQSEEPYLNSELNLIQLSELLHISPHILSYVINTGFNVNFPQFVNKYRVEKAKQLLQDQEKAKKLSILGIAYESGFNSKTVFNTAFKKSTGQTPSEFKRNCSDS